MLPLLIHWRPLDHRHTFFIKPLAANDECIRSGNLICLWSWTPRTTPRSSATHAPESGLISTDALTKSKNSKFYLNWMAVKGLRSTKKEEWSKLRVGNLSYLLVRNKSSLTSAAWLFLRTFCATLRSKIPISVAFVCEFTSPAVNKR